MFKSLYKISLNKYERQETRRKLLLQQQKLKRSAKQDINRQHENLRHCRKEESCHTKYKCSVLDNIQLQLSEWFKEKPDDINDWLLVPCPKGQRCLVVAEKGKTKMYSKNKKYRMTFSSLLPGGSLNGSDSDYCILDCIFNQENDTFYVLDALHFAIPLKDCDREFRFFWLKSKFNELDDLEGKHICHNVKSFKLLNNYDISNDRLEEVLQRYPLWQNNQPELDGFLFYHKNSHYVFGTTPLVCWLFPFMLPDILQMPVCSVYEQPSNYCHQNPWQYMDEFDKEVARRKNKKGLVLNFSAMEEDMETEGKQPDGCFDQDNILENLLTAEKILELEEVY